MLVVGGAVGINISVGTVVSDVFHRVVQVMVAAYIDTARDTVVTAASSTGLHENAIEVSRVIVLFVGVEGQDGRGTSGFHKAEQAKEVLISVDGVGKGGTARDGGGIEDDFTISTPATTIHSITTSVSCAGRATGEEVSNILLGDARVAVGTVGGGGGASVRASPMAVAGPRVGLTVGVCGVVGGVASRVGGFKMVHVDGRLLDGGKIIAIAIGGGSVSDLEINIKREDVTRESDQLLVVIIDLDGPVLVGITPKQERRVGVNGASLVSLPLRSG